MKIANGDSLTINLKSENDRKSYAKISISLAVDKKNKGYKKGLEAITANEDIIKNEIIKIVTNYTIDDMRDGQKELQDEVLVSLRKLFDSDFIVSVAFPTYTYEESSN